MRREVLVCGSCLLYLLVALRMLLSQVSHYEVRSAHVEQAAAVFEPHFLQCLVWGTLTNGVSRKNHHKTTVPESCRCKRRKKKVRYGLILQQLPHFASYATDCYAGSPCTHFLTDYESALQCIRNIHYLHVIPCCSGNYSHRAPGGKLKSAIKCWGSLA